MRLLSGLFPRALLILAKSLYNWLCLESEPALCSSTVTLNRTNFLGYTVLGTELE